MQIHFSYQHGSSNPELEKILNVHVSKLSLLLVRFSPDLAHLHGLLDFGSANPGSTCSLNLWLPTARLHATEHGRDISSAVRASFNHLREQVKKHKEVLRREGEWKRKRYKSKQENKKLEAGDLRVEDRQQLRDYLDQVLPQLKLFIARELRYQEMCGMPAEVQEDEIVDEVVARALESHKEFSGDSAPFHRLLKEAIRALNGMTSKAPASRSRDSSAAERTVSVAPANQGESVDRCLALLPPKQRQVYVLHALEGFSYEEAAQVLGQLPAEVEEVFRQVSQQVSATLQADPGHGPQQRSA